METGNQELVKTIKHEDILSITYFSVHILPVVAVLVSFSSLVLGMYS